MNWLTQVDPNNVILGLTTIGTLIGWLYHKARGEQTDSFRSLVGSIIDNFLHELVDQYNPSTTDVKQYLQTARSYIESKLWEVAAKRGVPRNALTERLAHEAIERGTAWLGNELAARRLPYQFDEIAKRLSDANARLIALQTQSPKAP